jgi:alpha-acetolactate decarboxylase
MKRFCLSALLLLALACGEARAVDRETLTQFSTIPALLAGLYDGEWSCAEVLAHGDIGIGTFDQLDGEMIVLDVRLTNQCAQLDLTPTLQQYLSTNAAFLRLDLGGDATEAVKKVEK